MPRKKPVVALASATSPPAIAARIHLIRGLRVMLDSDLAELYGVETGDLNQAVARNAARFPADFAFQLTPEEVTNLISQSVISSLHGGRRKPARVFTEQGVAMLSSVLRSPRAIDVNIAAVFDAIRELASPSADEERRERIGFITVPDVGSQPAGALKDRKVRRRRLH